MPPVYENLFDFAYIPEFERLVRSLAQKSQQENWSYDPAQGDLNILKNYISHTYKKIAGESKIAATANKACFNTGLFAPSNNEIFWVFTKNANANRQPWYSHGVYEASDIILSDFSTLPERASYFTSHEELIYDTNKELRINAGHILDANRENLERIPESVRDKPFLPTLLLGAVEDAKIKVRQNYRVAVPQYYNNAIQFLLPLCLTGRYVPDVALVVSRQDNFYIGHTCLSLQMAYNNARLIAKPMADWLLP
ncbi:MAG: DUF3825 domain-containing protein [Desulfovibrionaceae bacterium]|nr:DUF3825 domain-containing protein [Desulfovibrionaceae bacterium]